MFNKTDIRPIHTASGSTGSANNKPFESPATGRLARSKVWLQALLTAVLLTTSAFAQDSAGPVFNIFTRPIPRGAESLFVLGTKTNPIVLLSAPDAVDFATIWGNSPGYPYISPFGGRGWTGSLDVDGDGNRDFMVMAIKGWAATFYRNTGEYKSTSVVFPRATILVSGDFNGDGKIDILTGCTDLKDGQISVLVPSCPTMVGLGDGAFQFAPVQNDWKHQPRAIQKGDFNSDGKLDLATLNTDGTLSILLGDGTGKFTESWYMNYAGNDLSVGDYNGDGKLDVFAVGHNQNEVMMMTGDGAGHLSGPSRFSTDLRDSSGIMTPRIPLFVTAADFNGDGKLDFAVATRVDSFVAYSAASVYGPAVLTWLGDGNGNFRQAPDTLISFNPTAMLGTEDLNGDGLQDLVVASGGPDWVREQAAILMTHPALSTTSPSVDFLVRAGYPAPRAIAVGIIPALPSTIVVADQKWIKTTLIKDVKGNVTGVSVQADPASLAAGSYTGTVRLQASLYQPRSIKVNFYVANPSGKLKPISTLGFQNAVAVAAADFNGDGYHDLVVAESNNKVHVLIGTGNGGFLEVWNHTLETVQTTSLALADFNGDGKMDFAVAGTQAADGSSGFSVWLGTGTAQFDELPANKNIPGTGNISSIVAGDFNGDGRMDLAAQISFEGYDQTKPGDPLNAFVLLGDGTGRLTPAFTWASQNGGTEVKHPTGIAAADMNQDGWLDIVTVGTARHLVRFGDGTGRFSDGLSSDDAPPYQSPAQAVALFDVNGDALLDIVTATSQGVMIVATSGNYVIDPAPAQAVAVGDWNGDGLVDIAAASENGVTIYLGSGGYNFTKSGLIPAPKDPFTPGTMAVADFNNDGKMDLIVPGNGVTVLLGDAAGTGSVLSTTSGGTILSGQPLPLKLVLTPDQGAFNEPSGQVTFYDGSTALGVMNQTTSTYVFNALNLTPGTHTISAKYAGNARSAGSASNTLTVVVK